MASGIVTLNSNNTKLEGRVEWSSISNGPIENTSTVTASMQVRRTDTFGPTTGTWIGDCNINNIAESYSLHTSVSDDWVTMKTITKVVEHNNDGTKKCWISGYCDGPSGTSLAGAHIEGGYEVELDKIPRYGTSNQNLNSKTMTSIKMNWSSDNIVDYIWYSKDNGANWIGVDVTDGTSGIYNITGLTPNTTYNIKTRCRRKDSQLTTDSSSLSVTTYDIAKISSASNFNHGDNTTVGVTNPSGATAKLRLIVGEITIFNRNVSAGNNSISFSDTELDNIYKKYGSNNSVAATFIADTYNGSNVGWTNSKNVTIYLKGNQKTSKININGIWKRGKTWINVNGVWKKAVAWMNINGIWKRGI